VTRYDFTYLIALLAVRTGIPHSEYLKMDRSLLLATMSVLKEDSKRMENASRGKGAR
jgi:hypothetical protein